MKFLHVVAAVIEKNNRILLAKRPVEKHQGGLWEFPGGKLEPDETPHQALLRELKEELDIEINTSSPFLKVYHRYPDKAVFLDIYKVDDFEGEAKGLEGQRFEWVAREDLADYQFPAANEKIVSALTVPQMLSITPTDIEAQPSSKCLLEWREKILAYNIDGLLLRAPSLDDSAYITLFQTIKQFLQQQGLSAQVRLIINRVHLLDACETKNLHLSSMELKQLSTRMKNIFLSTSCHTEEEILLAEKFACNQVLLSPVLATGSHPDALSLGWDEAKTLTEKCKVPVLLLGGMKPEQILQAKDIGAFGLAGISNFF